MKAKRASLEEYNSNLKKRAASIELISSRFPSHNLQRVEIPGEGDCQFEVVATTAKLNLRLNELRLQVAEYLNQIPEFF